MNSGRTQCKVSFVAGTLEKLKYPYVGWFLFVG